MKRSIWLTLTFVSLLHPSVAAMDSFSRGDSNADGVFNVADPINTLVFLLARFELVTCVDAADSNDDGTVDFSDVVFSFTFLVFDGPPPPAPYPQCGADPTADGIGCAHFPREACPGDGNRCSEANPSTCLYQPDRTFDFRKLDLMELFPRHRRGPVELPEAQLSSLPITVWLPINADEPLPVVIWSHGGGSRRIPGESLPNWSRACAEAGYAVIAMHHMARSQGDFEQNFCVEQLGLSLEECDRTVHTTVYESMDRARDGIAVLDSLEDIGTEVGVSFDRDRIAVAGHSGGTNTPLYLAGGVRNTLPPQEEGELLFSAPDPRPRAFIAMSPPGAESAGWTTESLAAIERPVLTGTGAGDIVPERRIEPHDRFAPGDKYRIYIDSEAASHGVFALGDDGGTPERQELQDLFRLWIKSTGIAFLDAHVRGRSVAAEWLDSGDIGTAIEAQVGSGGIAPAWSTK